MNETLIKLEKLHKDNIKDIDFFIKKIKKFDEYTNWYINVLLDVSITSFYHFLFIEKNMVKAKQEAYIIGRCVEISSCIFDNDSSLGLWLRDTVFLLLSDNKELLDRFVDFKTTYYDETLKLGSWVACIQASLKDDWEFVEKQTAINLKRSKNKSSLEDAKFFEGLRDGDIPKMEEAINQLATKFHKRRNDESIVNELLSIPALGYAKLAWIKGYEVNIDNPLIPKELLPVKPNDEYEEYDFMKRKKFQYKDDNSPKISILESFKKYFKKNQ